MEFSESQKLRFSIFPRLKDFSKFNICYLEHLQTAVIFTMFGSHDFQKLLLK